MTTYNLKLNWFFTNLRNLYMGFHTYAIITTADPTTTDPPIAFFGRIYSLHASDDFCISTEHLRVPLTPIKHNPVFSIPTIFLA